MYCLRMRKVPHSSLWSKTIHAHCFSSVILGKFPNLTLNEASGASFNEYSFHHF